MTIVFEHMMSALTASIRNPLAQVLSSVLRNVNAVPETIEVLLENN